MNLVTVTNHSELLKGLFLLSKTDVSKSIIVILRCFNKLDCNNYIYIFQLLSDNKKVFLHVKCFIVYIMYLKSNI